MPFILKVGYFQQRDTAQGSYEGNKDTESRNHRVWSRKRGYSSLVRNWCFRIISPHFPDDSDGKESFCNEGDLGSIHGSGRTPREGNGNPLQYSCLENSMDRGAWWAAVHGVAEQDMTEQVTHTHKQCSNHSTMALISHASKMILKIQERFQQYVN